MKCNSCGHVNDDVSVFCEKCGKNLTDIIICPFCKEEVSSSAKFCKKCGNCIQPEIRVRFNYNDTHLSFWCDNKLFFDEMIRVLNDADTSYIEHFSKPVQIGLFYSLDTKGFASRCDNKRNDKIFEILISYLKQKGFKTRNTPSGRYGELLGTEYYKD